MSVYDQNLGYATKRFAKLFEEEDLEKVRLRVGSSEHGKQNILWVAVRTHAGKFAYPVMLTQDYQTFRLDLDETIKGAYRLLYGHRRIELEAPSVQLESA
jgi:hypothetical protein